MMQQPSSGGVVPPPMPSDQQTQQYQPQQQQQQQQWMMMQPQQTQQQQRQGPPAQAGWTQQAVAPPQQQAQQYGGAQNPGPDEIRSLWIGDLQQWMDENFILSCFAHTGEVPQLDETDEPIVLSATRQVVAVRPTNNDIEWDREDGEHDALPLFKEEPPK